LILRRVISHVREQQWTAIAIDFLIVVAGVFIGIQFSNWNDARLHEKAAQIYIERVSEDLLANQEDLRQRLTYFRQTRSHALATLEALREPRDKLGVEFLIDVYQASQIVPRGFGRETYDEIISVGANSAISDVAVRKRIANYYSSISAQLTTIETVTSYRELIRSNMPYHVQAAIRAACDDIVVTDASSGESTIVLPDNCEPDLDSESISNAINAIMEIDVSNELVRRISDLDAKLFTTQLVIDRANLLNDYLGDIQL
jgi:hypothetical protein